MNDTYENRTRFKRVVDRLQRAATMFFAMFEDPDKPHISVYDLSKMKWKRIALMEYFFIYSETDREIITSGDVRLLITTLWHVAKGKFKGDLIRVAKKIFDDSDYEDESTMLLRQLFGVQVCEEQEGQP